MPNPKMKSESYAQLSGMNSKVTPYGMDEHLNPYIATPLEFLNLSNFDFQTPGSLCQRWGSTQYLGQTFAAPIVAVSEFTRLDGTSHIIIGLTGGLWDGATTGNATGLSLTGLGATNLYTIAVNYCYPHLPNTSGSNIYRVFTLGAFYQGITSAALVGFAQFQNTIPGVGGGGDSFYIDPSLQLDNTMSYCTLDNFLFMADGNKFIKYDGTTTYAVGLPPPLWATNCAYDGNGNITGFNGFGAAIAGQNLWGASGAGFTSVTGSGFQTGPSFGTYFLYASYVNNRGFEGPIWPFLAINANTQYNATTTISADSVNGASGGFLNVSLMVATPLAFGISSINVYCYYDPYDVTRGETYIGFLLNDMSYAGQVQANYWNFVQPQLMQNVPASGSTFTSFGCGVAGTGLSNLLSNLAGPLESTIPNSYVPLGLTFAITSPNPIPAFDAYVNYYPRFLETFQGRLWLSGFSATPSVVWFSDTAEPEGYPPANNFEVRTNDGDYITCIKSYASLFYIFKKKSFHVLTGDNPNNFSVQERSDQYGCMNNRCAVTYDDVMFFLDQKGVMMWNGASLQCISIKLQPVFDSMNYQVALNTACMVHDKIRNQILIAIPINGSTTNNILVVFDYVANAWTTETINASSLASMFGRNNNKNAFYGDYSGRLSWCGPSFLADNGVGFTCYLESRFLQSPSDSTQKMYRRLFLNADSPASSTLVFGINFFQDYGATKVLSTTMVLSQFQNRIDFGISAKSLAFELSSLQTAVPLRIHGFTIESRFLRGV